MHLDGAHIYWYLAQPDGTRPWLPNGCRNMTFRHLCELARTVDRLGFAGLLVAAGRGRFDPWVTASSLAGVTSRLQFIVAQYPGVCSPQSLVDRIQAFRALFPGRIALNLVMGDRRSLLPHGLDLAHDERYALGHKYWRECCELAQAEMRPFSADDPTVMTGGGSEASMAFAAEHADVWLALGTPPAELAGQIACVRKLAVSHGRTMRFGVRLNVILRDSDEAAWEEAERTYTELRALKCKSMTDRAGDRVAAGALHNRMQALTQVAEDARQLQLHPGLWGGYHLFRSGPVTAAVGGPAEVGALLLEYRAAGVDLFILGGYPHTEEARRFASFLTQANNMKGHVAAI